MDTLCTRRAFIRRFAFAAGVTATLARGADKAATRPARRIGLIAGAGLPELTDAFRKQLRELGWVEGANVLIEERLIQPNAQDANAQISELARMDLELIVAGGLSFALPVRAANPSMPMVIATAPGLVSNGFAKTLEHPGGLYTGMDELPGGVTGKRLMLLRTAAPNIRRVALLSTTPGHGGHETQVADAENAAKALGITVKPYRAASLAELRAALGEIVADAMDGMLNFQGGLSLANRLLITGHMNEHRLPAIYQATLFAEAGGLMAWAPDLVEQYREAARCVDKILNGASPGDLPIKHPAKYFLTLNTSAARKIGLVLPAGLLQQATRVLPA